MAQYPNSFNVEYEAEFEVTANGVTWAYGFLGHEKTPEMAAPNYLQSVIASLLQLERLEKRFKVHLQYLTVKERFLISYDVIEANHEPLSYATFDCESFDADQALREEFFRSLYQGLAIAQDPKCLASTDLLDGAASSALASAQYWLKAGYIDHDIEVTKFEVAVDKQRLAAKMKSHYRRHPFGEYAAVFALPPFPLANQYPKAPIAIAGFNGEGKCDKLSDIALENLVGLEMAMALPNPKIVFIQGEPGSGKDSFANAIHFGSKRSRSPKLADNPVSRSVSGMTLDRFRRELYGEDLEGGLHDPGLIEKATEGTLFLDEFDKFAEGDNAPYSELLRVWEAKQFLPVNGRKVREVEDVNWVVAGAFTSVRKTSDLPPDIWSRFSTQLSIKSPLSVAWIDSDERTAYIRSLTLAFMLSMGLKQTEKTGVKGAMRRFREPRSRPASVVCSMLFRDGDATKLEPSGLMIGTANALASYIGVYNRCVFQTPRVAVEICLPTWLASGAMFDFEHMTLKFDVSSAGNGGDNTRELHVEHDSIRAIRQACSVVFGRYYEFLLQGRATSSDIEDRVTKMLTEAFATVDVARQGRSPEEFMSRARLREAVFSLSYLKNTVKLISTALGKCV